EGHEIYDPCSPKSRLGITRKNFREDDLHGVTGLHFHTLCEQNSDDLKKTLDAIEGKFGDILPKMEWINFGGGHHITREDYDIQLLESCIMRMKEKYGLEVFLEPGEAFALNAGYLVTEVLDLTENDMPIAILDTSAACHMPDVLEMPYRPPLMNSGQAGEKKFIYRLGSQTCLAGDSIGEYSFDEPLKIGDRLIFCDMAIYSMVKNNTFNGMPLPSIYLKKSEGEIVLLRQFGYNDFKERL
ncbi:MAG: carboxynorspermidine decarboxylase, partial [Ruminococcus sp.]|nr:carboxynorspermidine decarboxylase [Ruminococcus sp.]